MSNACDILLIGGTKNGVIYNVQRPIPARIVTDGGDYFSYIEVIDGKPYRCGFPVTDIVPTIAATRAAVLASNLTSAWDVKL